MNPTVRTRRPARWPFWLLLAAWICANTPAIAVCAALTWLGKARHFSHQQQLVTDVAFVLTGNKAPGLGVMAAVKQVALPQPLPPATSGLELKKIDLAVERLVEVRRPTAREKEFVMHTVMPREAWRDAPPHEPPRGTAMS